MDGDQHADLDESLRRWFSSLSPAQRLRAVQSHANLIVAARGLERVLRDRERDDRLPLTDNGPLDVLGKIEEDLDYSALLPLLEAALHEEE